ncbi:tetratricopeptide repeat protein, partial [Acidobacteriota bacterium]
MKQKKVIFMAVLLVMGVSLLFSGLVKQESAKELFERAVYLQETRGDLEGAMGVYQRIIKDFPKERVIAAKAQLQIGICLQKLGMSEAQKAFQAVLEKYPDQTEAVKIAREKLSLLLKAKSVIENKSQELKIQKILSGREASVSGEISPDGKYLSFVDWGTGDLAIREMATGKSRRLTNKGSWMESQEFALQSRWSPDGKQVFYNWYDPEGDTFDIYSVGTEGQKPRMLYKTHDFGYTEPFAWHPDGERMLIGFYEQEEDTFGIGYLSAADGHFQVLKTFKRKFYQGNPWGFNISPDGKSIAYDDCRDENPNNRDIFLLSSDGTHEEQLIAHPSLDSVMDWTSDGEYLLFGSERTGNLGVWIVPVKGGKANGPASLLKANIGPVSSLGCTLQDQFYFGYVGTAINDVYVVEIDPLSGLVLTPPKVEIPYNEGHNLIPDYSPDGKYLAYAFLRRLQPMEISIRLYSLENGGIRELDQGSCDLNYPQWRPDGEAISWEGTDGDGKRGIYLMDLESENVSPLIQIEDTEEILSHRWAIDGQILF